MKLCCDIFGHLEMIGKTVKGGGGGGGCHVPPPPPPIFLGLKTLFNIVEAPFTKKKINFDVCVVWCSDGPINSQE